GKRMGTRLRSVSAMWTGTVEVWSSGTTDDYDEWAYVASFLDVARRGEATERIRAALRRVGLALPGC
ncbi:MAG: hypothetical protein AAGE52_29915, partial [Myxococcota bacterium]